ncbi:MAG TPA: hypothetical protein PKW20_05610, partial [Syntrophales bacterium]|nr:hypothetical protein [Syntrophales bacterium]
MRAIRSSLSIRSRAAVASVSRRMCAFRSRRIVSTARARSPTSSFRGTGGISVSRSPFAMRPVDSERACRGRAMAPEKRRAIPAAPRTVRAAMTMKY